MMRFVVVVCFFCSLLMGGGLEILSVKQTQNGITLRFNQTITKNHFKKFVLENKQELRYVYDIQASLMGSAKSFEIQGTKIKIAQNSPTKVRLVIQTPKKLEIALALSQKQASFTFPNTNNISIPMLFGKDTSKNSKINTNDKIIVIDPGHGGKDCGAVGVNKTCEKNVVLKIGLYLRDNLKERGYKVYMTRSSDKFVGLRDRTKFANNKNADLFISCKVFPSK